MYRVFQDFESSSSLNLCHCKQLRFPDCGLFNSTVLRDLVCKSEILIASRGKVKLAGLSKTRKTQ